MDIIEELDVKFRALDDESKLVVALWGFSQCACSHRRFVGIGQLKHARDYIVDDEAAVVAERVDPSVAEAVRTIRGMVEQVAADPPEYLTDELGPRGPATTRDFLWSDAFEEPIWFDMRHPARAALTVAEGRFRAAAAGA